MALIQALPATAIPATFGMLAEFLLTQLFTRARKYKASSVDFVIDNYYTLSIKGGERTKRGDTSKTGARQLQIINGEVKVPSTSLKWKAYLSSGPNKRALLQFLVTTWQRSTLPGSVIIYATSEKKCTKLLFAPDQLPVIQDVPELTCDHEEADTRLIAHAVNAADENYYTVVIESPDTDTAVLTLGHSKRIKCEVLAFVTGTKDKRRILDIKTMSLKLGEEMTEALMGVHAFSGCDTVSSFAGKGKKTHYELIKQNKDCRTAMQMLGTSFECSDELMARVQQYTCLLYGGTGHDVNKLRFKLFINRSGASQAMPPCKDSLAEHIKRSNYVAAIWKSAMTSIINAPSPTEHGWLLDDNEYIFKWHSGEVAPPNVLKTVFCSCKKSKCKKSMCSCSAAKLPCTELCQCLDCGNGAHDVGETEIAEDSDNGSDEDE